MFDVFFITALLFISELKITVQKVEIKAQRKLHLKVNFNDI